MQVRITEYEPIDRKYIMQMPTVKIRTWEESIPEQRHADGYISNFMAADFVGRKYPGKTLGVIVLK
jgi:hypothetical protein